MKDQDYNKNDTIGHQVYTNNQAQFSPSMHSNIKNLSHILFQPAQDTEGHARGLFEITIKERDENLSRDSGALRACLKNFLKLSPEEISDPGLRKWVENDSPVFYPFLPGDFTEEFVTKWAKQCNKRSSFNRIRAFAHHYYQETGEALAAATLESVRRTIPKDPHINKLLHFFDFLEKSEQQDRLAELGAKRQTNPSPSVEPDAVLGSGIGSSLISKSKLAAVGTPTRAAVDGELYERDEEFDNLDVGGRAKRSNLRAAMHTLEPGGYLEDKIINTMLNGLQRKTQDPSIRYFTTDQSDSFFRFGEDSPLDITGVKRFFLPLNHADRHWTSLVGKQDEHDQWTLHHYDSLQNHPYREKAEQKIEKVCEALGNVGATHEHAFPQQSEAECGLYCVGIAQQLAAGTLDAATTEQQIFAMDRDSLARYLQETYPYLQTTTGRLFPSSIAASGASAQQHDEHGNLLPLQRDHTFIPNGGLPERVPQAQYVLPATYTDDEQGIAATWDGQTVTALGTVARSDTGMPRGEKRGAENDPPGARSPKNPKFDVTQPLHNSLASILSMLPGTSLQGPSLHGDPTNQPASSANEALADGFDALNPQPASDIPLDMWMASFLGESSGEPWDASYERPPSEGRGRGGR